MADRPGYRQMHVEVPEDMYLEFCQRFPYNMKSEVIRRLISLANEAHEEVGAVIVGALGAGDVSLVYDPGKRENIMFFR